MHGAAELSSAELGRAPPRRRTVNVGLHAVRLPSTLV